MNDEIVSAIEDELRAMMKNHRANLEELHAAVMNVLWEDDDSRPHILVATETKRKK